MAFTDVGGKDHPVKRVVLLGAPDMLCDLDFLEPLFEPVA
jgi:hypothetical protein